MCGRISDNSVGCSAGLLNSAYDTVSNTASSVVSGSAKLVQNTANYVGDTAEKFTKK
jgi:hypothetical protein